jgi:S-formylglutathione hydrolase FrmB
MRRTSIERYVAPLGLAVIMPNVHRSYYTDMAVGGAYWTFLTEELPTVMHSFFNLSDKRDDHFVAGLSMGGYGAMKWGLSKPEYFSHVASLSGVLDINDTMQQIINGKKGGHFNVTRRAEFEAIFGAIDKVKGSPNDLFHLIEKLTTSDVPIPKLFQCCGTEDFLYKNNLNFKKFISSYNQIDLTYMEGSGVHSWDFWDTYIQHVLKWLPLNSK